MTLFIAGFFLGMALVVLLWTAKALDDRQKSIEARKLTASAKRAEQIRNAIDRKWSD